jgi:hypothetical protein
MENSLYETINHYFGKYISRKKNMPQLRIEGKKSVLHSNLKFFTFQHLKVYVSLITILVK